MALVEIENLSVEFPTQGGVMRAVDGVSLTLNEGEVLGVVGESGSGKSVTMLALMGLIPFPGRVKADKLSFNGRNLLTISDRERRQLTGKDVAMIFQEPTTSLNPSFTIEFQLTETLRLHEGMDRKAARRRAVELLEQVGIPSPESRLSSFPHQLSGGMNQRVMIAMAIACNPKLLIADEPTTALDVTIQAQILELLKGLVRDQGTALMLITHDLGVVAGLCDRVNVMYSGRIVERADRRTLFVEPRHPYTVGLLGSIPRLDSTADVPLTPIPGSPTDTLPWASACAFAPRCPRRVDEICTTVTPALEPDGPRWLRCHNPVPAAEAVAVGAEGRR